jgi:hypothetical protein
MRRHGIAAADIGRGGLPPLCAGIASVGVVSRNFDAQRLIEAAERCLDAARQGGPASVKSIELY